MKPKQWIRYVKRLEKRGYAICDGVTNEFGFSWFDILYPIFLITSIPISIWILMNWQRIKEKIKH